MQAIESAFKELFEALPPSPVHKSTLDQLVARTILQAEPNTSSENRKTQWEYALRNEVFSLAVRVPPYLLSAVNSGHCSVGYRRPGSERPDHHILR